MEMFWQTLMVDDINLEDFAVSGFMEGVPEYQFLKWIYRLVLKFCKGLFN